MEPETKSNEHKNKNNVADSKSVKCPNCKIDLKSPTFLAKMHQENGCSATKKVGMNQERTERTQGTPIMKQDKVVANYFAGRDQFVKQVGIGGKGDKIRKPEGNGNSKRTKRSNEDSYGQFHYKAQRRHNIMEPKSIKRKNKNNAEVSKSVKCPKCIKTLKSPSDLELHGCSTPTTSFTPTTKKVEMYQKKTGSTQRTPIMKQDQAITNYFARRDQFVKQVGGGDKGNKRRAPLGNSENSKGTKRSKEDSYVDKGWCGMYQSF